MAKKQFFINLADELNTKCSRYYGPKPNEFGCAWDWSDFKGNNDSFSIVSKGCRDHSKNICDECNKVIEKYQGKYLDTFEDESGGADDILDKLKELEKKIISLQEEIRETIEMFKSKE